MKSTLLHLIIWLSVCIGAFVAYEFLYAALANKSIAVANLQNQIDMKTEASKRITAARTALAEIAGDESVVQSYFVPETGVVSFIDDLEARARAQTATMKVLSVSIGGVATAPTLVLSLIVDGTFDAVMRTIGAIEYAPYDLSISRLSLEKTEENVWHAELGLIVGSVPATP